LAKWSILLGWLGSPGRGRALGMGEVKFSVRCCEREEGRLRRRLQAGHALETGIGHRRWLAFRRREVIYKASDLKVGLFKQEAAMQPGGA